MKILFASSNRDKFLEVNSILEQGGVEAEFAKIELAEIQSNDLRKVAEDKVRKAYAVLKEPVLVEDDGLFIHDLAGFPGVYSSYVFKTIGNEGILKLMPAAGKRSAEFVAVMGHHDGQSVSLFSGSSKGIIALELRGRGWGFDPIFIPDDASGLTYAELQDRKGNFSHRRRALDAFVRKMNVK